MAAHFLSKYLCVFVLGLFVCFSSLANALQIEIIQFLDIAGIIFLTEAWYSLCIPSPLRLAWPAGCSPG